MLTTYHEAEVMKLGIVIAAHLLDRRLREGSPLEVDCTSVRPSWPSDCQHNCRSRGAAQQRQQLIPAQISRGITICGARHTGLSDHIWRLYIGVTIICIVEML